MREQCVAVVLPGMAERWRDTDVVAFSQISSWMIGACEFWFRVVDRGNSLYRPREAYFLGEVLPRGSAFHVFAEAGFDDDEKVLFVQWSILVVGRYAVGVREWAASKAGIAAALGLEGWNVHMEFFDKQKVGSLAEGVLPERFVEDGVSTGRIEEVCVMAEGVVGDGLQP